MKADIKFDIGKSSRIPHPRKRDLRFAFIVGNSPVFAQENYDEGPKGVTTSNFNHSCKNVVVLSE